MAWRTAQGLESSDQLLFDSPPGTDIVAEVETVQSLAAKASLAVTDSAHPIVPATGATTVKRRKISKQQRAIDPECGAQGQILQSPDGLRVYSVTLNQVEPGISK